MRQIVIYISALFIFLSSCVQEDHFGWSTYGNIKTIEISNQASQAVINQTNFEISIEFPGGVDLTELTIKTLTLSSFAESDKNVGDLLDLSQTANIQVTAEDGSLTTWTIVPEVASSTPQLVNGDFNLWYQTTTGYYEPGADANSTIWGTGNPGTQVLGLLATTPLEISNENLAAKLETLDNGKLAGTFGTPISAGSIFTGKFDKDKIDPSDPEAAIDFGTPFSGRPATLKFTYSFVPGDTNKDKDGNTIAEGDKCDVYAYLEIRNGTQSSRLATAWFRSGDEQNERVSKEIDFVYGQLNNSNPDYMFPANGVFVSADSSSFVLPSHLTFVATSSYDGANFAGAIGSTLVIDDVELVYEE